MKKLITLILILSIVAMALPAFAQDEMVEVDEAVVERLVEFNENLPAGYGAIGADEVAQALAERADELFLLDVREPGELEETGFIEGAVNIPIRSLPEHLDLLPSFDTEIIVICAGGARAMLAQASLNILGWEKAQTMKGGFGAWVAEEFPIVEGEMPAEAEAGEMPEFVVDEAVVEAVSMYLSELPEGFGLVRAAALNEELIENPDLYMIDVRGESEWNDVGYIAGANWMWIDEFMANADMLPEDMEMPIVVYCASSYRGGIAAVMMSLLGYTNVRNLVGGINAWIAEGLPLEGAPES